MRRVAYLGPEGTNSHDAALSRYGESALLVPVTDIPTVVASVTARSVDEAIVPIENSTEGSVTVGTGCCDHPDAARTLCELVTGGADHRPLFTNGQPLLI